MVKALSLYGKRFGRLQVISREESSSTGKSRWRCLCDCGAETIAHGADLANGHSTTCGCGQRDATKRVLTTHGSTETAEYRIWCLMKGRCLNPRDRRFTRYGGRGITVCERWRSDFAAFLSDMGPRPTPRHSIDRIDNNGNYEPSNCRWATPKEQARNTRRTRYVEIGGVVGRLAQVADDLGIPYGTMKQRARRGSFGVHLLPVCITVEH